MKTLCLFLVIGLITFTFAQNESKLNKKDMNNKDMNKNSFVEEAASGGMMEVELGNMASEKAISKEVKEYGELLAKDHSKANEELKTIAKNDNIVFPDKMSKKHNEIVENFKKVKKEKFDKKYIDMMTEDHKKDIQKFEKAAEDNKNVDVKEWAKKTLPTLKKHLQKAENISDTLNKKNVSSNRVKE